MKNLIILVAIIIACASLWGNGMLIMDAYSGAYMDMYKCQIDIQINNQAALTTSSMYFHNQTGEEGLPKFAFPLQDNASATSLRWLVNGTWHQAVIAPGQGGGIVPPGEPINAFIDAHLGKTPLVFSIPQIVSADSNVVVQITYVQLLPYSNGTVSYSYPSDNDYLSYVNMDTLSVNLQVFSPRQITALDFPGFEHNAPVLNGTSATCHFYLNDFEPDRDLPLTYTLAMDDLGIGSISTFVNHTNVPDNLGDGFFLMLAEPEPTGDVIQKYFTFIIDRSISMSGTKLDQAKQAANFMVNNLNPGDYFNIVDFSTIAGAFAVNHVPFNITNCTLALNYINHLEPFGSTNYSGAFDMAIPQFTAANPNAANIIVFLTGSQANTGIIQTGELLTHLNTLIDQTERNISLFCFGVGDQLNFQLLSAMANGNNGIATSVGLNNLLSVLVDFYSNIRNPIVLNPSVQFNGQPNTITQIYPSPLPNLYLGQQMLICGRYSTPQAITLNINGTAYGSPVSYAFGDTLATQEVTLNVFLMKVWAKLKIENLLIQYHLLVPGSAAALNLREQIEELSMDYGVLCEFTNFSGGEVNTDDDTLPLSCPVIRLLGNYPNPFNPSTKISFEVNTDKELTVEIEIYNQKGQLIKKLVQVTTQKGTHQFSWDGRDSKGNAVASGIYLYKVKAAGVQLSSKMILIK